VLFHLAEGTFARVYRGMRSESGEPVAVKVLRKRFGNDPESVARFNKEAQEGMKLRHSNLRDQKNAVKERIPPSPGSSGTPGFDPVKFSRSQNLC
jgi:serine/threonine protein kinase